VSGGWLGVKTQRCSGKGDGDVQTVEASGGFGPTDRNGGEAAEAQTGAVGAGEARQEAAADRATTTSGPARPDRGAALMAWARAWRCTWHQVERRVRQVGLGAESRDQLVGPHDSDFPN
jgi:hypothetical protein